METSNIKHLALVFASLISLAISLGVQASEDRSINVTAVYGADTNPHDLSGAFDTVQQSYWAAELSYKANFFDWIWIDLNGRKDTYLDDTRANRFESNASLAIGHDFDLFDENFGFKITTNQSSLDKTYVSKFTGQVTLFNGQSIADRYDVTSTNNQFDFNWRTNEKLNVLLAYRSFADDFEDYNISGLSNLDSDAFEARIGMEYIPSDVGFFFLHANYQEKNFVDRRARDLTNALVPDTDLSFEIHNANIGYIWEPEEGIYWEFVYNYHLQTDLAFGYYDGTGGYISAEGRYKINDYNHIYGTLKIDKFSFEKQINPIQFPLDEDALDEYGGSIFIGYEWIFATLFTSNIAFYIDAEYDTSTNKLPEYTYERIKASAGIRFSVF